MKTKIKDLPKKIKSNRTNLKGFLKPFIKFRSSRISKSNLFVSSYIYEFDKIISSKNYLVRSSSIPKISKNEGDDDD
ncbi:MAG: hypothetical protein JSW64_14090 [Candidatus Zixiibacteriota bacterium]|nr:MAG: hypothetical protein JSW64_14090 [candidate division Zixibacteria bacterium]